jgi:hypothetical protein
MLLRFSALKNYLYIYEANKKGYRCNAAIYSH